MSEVSQSTKQASAVLLRMAHEVMQAAGPDDIFEATFSIDGQSFRLTIEPVEA